MSQTGIGVTYRLYAGEPASHDQAGFEALTFTEYEGVTNLGTVMGATFTSVTTTPLKTGITKTRKGSKSYGEITPTADYDPDDAGQALFISGVDGAEQDTVFSHEFTLQDGTVIYNTGQIFEAPVTVGTADDMVTVTGKVIFDNVPVVVSA